MCNSSIVHNKTITIIVALWPRRTNEEFSHSQKYQDHIRPQMEGHRCDSCKLDKNGLPPPDLPNPKPQNAFIIPHDDTVGDIHGEAH